MASSWDLVVLALISAVVIISLDAGEVSPPGLEATHPSPPAVDWRHATAQALEPAAKPTTINGAAVVQSAAAAAKSRVQLAAAKSRVQLAAAQAAMMAVKCQTTAEPDPEDVAKLKLGAGRRQFGAGPTTSGGSASGPATEAQSESMKSVEQAAQVPQLVLASASWLGVAQVAVDVLAEVEAATRTEPAGPVVAAESTSALELVMAANRMGLAVPVVERTATKWPKQKIRPTHQASMLARRREKLTAVEKDDDTAGKECAEAESGKRAKRAAQGRRAMSTAKGVAATRRAATLEQAQNDTGRKEPAEASERKSQALEVDQNQSATLERQDRLARAKTTPAEIVHEIKPEALGPRVQSNQIRPEAVLVPACKAPHVPRAGASLTEAHVSVELEAAAAESSTALELVMTEHSGPRLVQRARWAKLERQAQNEQRRPAETSRRLSNEVEHTGKTKQDAGVPGLWGQLQPLSASHVIHITAWAAGALLALISATDTAAVGSPLGNAAARSIQIIVSASFCCKGAQAATSAAETPFVACPDPKPSNTTCCDPTASPPQRCPGEIPCEACGGADTCECPAPAANACLGGPDSACCDPTKPFHEELCPDNIPCEACGRSVLCECPTASTAYPKCGEKYTWLKANWQTNEPWFSMRGVDGSDTSTACLLGNIENWCPPVQTGCPASSRVFPVESLSSATANADLKKKVDAWLQNSTDASVMYGRIQDWDTSAVTDMSGLFISGEDLGYLYDSTSFNENISGWNVSQVTDMRSMFYGAASFDQDLSGWDVSQVTDMRYMLKGASSFNKNISSWDVSRVTTLQTMFYEATSFNKDLSSWNVSQVTTMQGMFWGATSFNKNISNWDVGRVTNTQYMFKDATAFNQKLCWDLNAATYEMFDESKGSACEQICDDILSVDADGYTCGARIEFVKKDNGMTEQEARQLIAGEFPSECGACGVQTTPSITPPTPTPTPTPTPPTPTPPTPPTPTPPTPDTPAPATPAPDTPAPAPVPATPTTSPITATPTAATPTAEPTTATPTADPTPSGSIQATPIEIKQDVRFGNLNESVYVGDIQKRYEKGYGVAIGACTDSCDTYVQGVSISSSASERRDLTVTFSTTLTGLGANAVASLSSGCSGSCTVSSLQAAISQITGTEVEVQEISAAIRAQAEVPADAAPADEEDSANNVVVIVLIAAGALVLAISVAMLVWCLVCKNASTQPAAGEVNCTLNALHEAEGRLDPIRPKWLSETGPPQLEVPVIKWSMSISQVKRYLGAVRNTELYGIVRAEDEERSPADCLNLYQVNDFWTIPWTRNRGCGIALLTNQDGLEAKAMVSHGAPIGSRVPDGLGAAWGEDMEELEDALNDFMTQQGLVDDFPLWICAFANYRALSHLS